MRNYETSTLELRLKWPGMDGLWEPMHWTQDINPVTMWIEEAYSGEELDIDYTCVSCPYYSYNYWGGLEYNNDDALLDKLDRQRQLVLRGRRDQHVRVRRKRLRHPGPLHPRGRRQRLLQLTDAGRSAVAVIESILKSTQVSRQETMSRVGRDFSSHSRGADQRRCVASE